MASSSKNKLPKQQPSKKQPAKEKFPPRPRALGARRVQADVILQRLAEVYPDSTCALNFRNPFELLVATVLSAQTTDKRVNEVTPMLFARFPTPEAMSHADVLVLEEILRPLGFFRAKAKSLLGLSAALVNEFDGEVPADLPALVKLPGVGRKTANVVLGNAFGIPGITVDTHVGRLARRFGMTRETDPVKAELELQKVWGERDWTLICHRIIDHGRSICHARNPQCLECPLADVCPSYELLRD